MSADPALSGVREALRAALPDRAPLISVSRVRTPRFTAILPALTVESLPVVWGRTLWGEASGSSVVEQPNGLGILETDAPADAAVVTTLGNLSLVRRRDAEVPVPRSATALRGRLLQLTGVQPATRRLESGRFVLLFPCEPQRITSVAPPDGVTAAALGADLAEYPGGVRFEVVGNVVESKLTEYAAIVADRLAEPEGLT